MPETRRAIELRSEEVQEIMSRIPNWMIRRGMSLILLLIILVIGIAWMIKYPDVITGKAELSTEKSTIRLVTKSSGEIDNIYFTDQVNVKAGDVIAVLKNSTSLEARTYLLSVCEEIKKQLKSTRPSFSFSDEHLILGGIHQDYLTLKNAALDYQFFTEKNPLKDQILTLNKQIQNHRSLTRVSEQQLSAADRLRNRAKEKYVSDSTLYSNKVISKMEFYTEEEKLIRAEDNVRTIRKNIVQNEIALTDLEKQSQQLSFDYEKQQSDVLARLNTALKVIENSLENWSQNFEIKAPIDGKLSYLDNLKKYQFIETGIALFAITPIEQTYKGQLIVAEQGYGKLRIGQTVHIKLNNYPSHEFGQLEGTVSAISLVKNEQKYRVEFTLNNGMQSSYGKSFSYTPEMAGVAEIITEDLRLTDRIFSQFRKLINY